MEPLGKRLREAIGQRFQQDGRIVIARQLKGFSAFVHAQTGGHREEPDMVRNPDSRWRNKIGQGCVGCPSTRLIGGSGQLLT